MTRIRALSSDGQSSRLLIGGSSVRIREDAPSLESGDIAVKPIASVVGLTLELRQFVPRLIGEGADFIIIHTRIIPHAHLAQWLEHQSDELKVRGSNPRVCTL